jgi:prepilin-type N-terminal cleavage/methylation domain-containing protein
MKRNFPNGGYTLIELMAVLVVLSIILLLSVPKFTSLQDKYVFDVVVNEFLNDLRTAQMMAIKEGRHYRAEFTDNQRYAIKSEDRVVFQTEKVVIMPKGITYTDTFKLSKYSFSLNGMEINNGGTITIKNSKGRSAEITITPITGRIARIK